MILEEKEVCFRKIVKTIPSTTYATFALYRYPAKFIPQVIAYVLERYAPQGSKIFDPFAGYGTVGVVSRIYGYDYELWDLNPLLEVLHKVATLELGEINIDKLLVEMSNFNGEFKPSWSKLSYWFAEEFLPFLFRVWGFYHSMDDDYNKFILTIPLLKVTRYFSYDDMQRMKLSKSPKSKKRVEKLLKSDWKKEFLKTLREELVKLRERLREYWLLNPKPVKAIIKSGMDALNEGLKEERDILITSPPYLQSQEYIRQAKLDLFWLGYSEETVKRLSGLEIPYRSVPPFPVHSETFKRFRDRISEKHLLKLFDKYFYGVLGALTRLSEKINSYLFVFVGRASMRGKPVPIDHIIAEHFTSLGWKYEGILADKIVARQMFRYGVNPATEIKDARTSTENLVILRRKH